MPGGTIARMRAKINEQRKRPERSRLPRNAAKWLSPEFIPEVVQQEANMHSNANPATPDEKQRFEQIQQIGCLACLKHKNWRRACEIHHLTDYGRRRGHSFTIGLCPWHHRAVTDGAAFNAKAMEKIYGPSLVQGSKGFKATYGTDDDLLTWQNELIEDLKKQSQI